MQSQLPQKERNDLFRAGREVNFALPVGSSSLRPSASDIASAAKKLGISVAAARRALSHYHFGA